MGYMQQTGRRVKLHTPMDVGGGHSPGMSPTGPVEIPAGATGTILHWSKERVAVLMARRFHLLDDWDNQLIFTENDTELADAREEYRRYFK